jgi:hypothetical protein
VQRFEWKAGRPPTNRSKCLCWENTIILKAKDREVAFRKATFLAKKSATGKWELLGDPPGRPGRWILEGLTSLLPIYEPLEDGAKVLWSESCPMIARQNRGSLAHAKSSDRMSPEGSW